jgi:hypothetical protein
MSPRVMRPGALRAVTILFRLSEMQLFSCFQVGLPSQKAGPRDLRRPDPLLRCHYIQGLERELD